MSLPKTAKHFVITRFNVPLRFSCDKHKDSNWINSRLNLLVDYCHPTLSWQSCKNFDWLVMIHDESPDWLSEAIAGLDGPVRVKPIRVSNWSKKELSRVLKPMCEGFEYLVTTRLDSDDGLAFNFIEEVQARFEERDLLAINFERGYHRLRSTERWYRTIAYHNNPFLTLIEALDTEDIDTVYLCDHPEMDNFAEVVSNKKEGMWFVLAHGGNVGNRKRGIPVRAHPVAHFPARRDVNQAPWPLVPYFLELLFACAYEFAMYARKRVTGRGALYG
jgi:hypothetical protein